MIDTHGVLIAGDVIIRVFSEGILPMITDRAIFRLGTNI